MNNHIQDADCPGCQTRAFHTADCPFLYDDPLTADEKAALLETAFCPNCEREDCRCDLEWLNVDSMETLGLEPR